MTKRIKSPFCRLSTLFIVSIISFNKTYSQDSSYRTTSPVFVQASFIYDFPQSYGISADIIYPFSSIIKQRISKGSSVSTKQRDRFWGMQAAAYRYPFNYTGLLLVPFLGLRRYVKPRFFYELSFGVGVLRSFYDGKVYEVDASGSVRERPVYGKFYATTHVSSGFNFLLQTPGSKLLALQLKPSIWFQYPFESFIKPHISFELGIKREIDHRNVKSQKITKHSRK